MTHKKSKNNLPDPIAQEVGALLSGANLIPENDKSEVEPVKPAEPADPIDVESMLADADIDLGSISSPEPVEQKPETESNPERSREEEVDDLLTGIDLTRLETTESAEPVAEIPTKIPTKMNPIFVLRKETEEETGPVFDLPDADEEETDPGIPTDEPEVKAVVEEPVIENLEKVSSISGAFDQAEEDGDTEDEDFEPKEDDTQPHEFAEKLKPSSDEIPEFFEADQPANISPDAEKRRQTLINRLIKKFGPDVIDEIQKASEVLNPESMQNLLLQYWAEDQEFKAEDEIHKAQERLNKKSWKQKIAESRTIGQFFPIGSAILGIGLGIAGSVAARSGANMLIKKALMKTVHHGLGEVTAVAVGGTFGAVKGYLHEKERRRDAKQLLADIGHAVNVSNINGVGGLQLINEAIKDGLKGDEETMQKIFDWQTHFRFMAINEHQLGELAEQGLEQVEQGKSANEVILDNLSELLDNKANLEFKESKNKFKKMYGRGWEQMGAKMGKGALAGGITSLLAYELAHLVADAVGNWWAAHHGGTTAPPAALAPEHTQAPSHPTTPEATPSHPPLAETPTTQAPSTPPAAEPTLPNQPTAEALPIPESPHHITNPTDYARELTIEDPTFQDMVHKFADGQVSGEDGADWILNHHGVMANYQIPELNDATLSDQLQEFVQANHDKLSDHEMLSAVYNAASHPTILVDYQTGQLSAEQLASDWHNLTHSLSEVRGDDIAKNVDKFIASQNQLWNGAHLPKNIAEEFMQTQHIVDAASTATSSLPSEPSSPSLPQPTTPPEPLKPLTSSPVSFWQSPTGNGLKALGLLGTASVLAGVGLHYRDKKKLDNQPDQSEQSSQPDQPTQQEEPSEKNKSEQTKQESDPVIVEIVYNKPETIEEFIDYVQKDLVSKLQDLPVNSVIMELTTGAPGRSAEVYLSFQANKIDLGNLDSQNFTTGSLGDIDLGQSRTIWFPNGESILIYEVGDHIGVRDVDNASRKPDFSKPGHFEFYYIN